MNHLNANALINQSTMALKSKCSPKRERVTQSSQQYVTCDSDVCSYELISLSSSISAKQWYHFTMLRITVISTTTTAIFLMSSSFLLLPLQFISSCLCSTIIGREKEGVVGCLHLLVYLNSVSFSYLINYSIEFVSLNKQRRTPIVFYHRYISH